VIGPALINGHCGELLICLVSKYTMHRPVAREIALATILAVLTTGLFRCWLIYPILKHMTTNQARFLAMLAAALFGAVSAFLGLRTYICAPAVFVGLISSGIWLSLFPPMRDVATSFVSEFHSYLELFWREISASPSRRRSATLLLRALCAKPATRRARLRNVAREGIVPSPDLVGEIHNGSNGTLYIVILLYNTLGLR
jgi:hypothetical protein